MYELTIGNHPAQARHPVTNELLFDNDGVAVPMFPDQKSIRFDGTIVAYVANGNLLIINSRLPSAIVDEMKDLAATLGDVNQVSTVPEETNGEDDE